jgi:hypothetical protein
MRQELPAPVDQLPAPGHQARQLQQGGGGLHHPPPRPARQQVPLLTNPASFSFPFLPLLPFLVFAKLEQQ